MASSVRKTRRVVSRIERRQQRSSSARRTGSRTKKSTLPKLVTTQPAGHEDRAGRDQQ